MNNNWMVTADVDRTWEETQHELDSLLAAVSSYPARAALNPDYNFTQHLGNVVALGDSYLFPQGYPN